MPAGETTAAAAADDDADDEPMHGGDHDTQHTDTQHATLWFLIAEPISMHPH
jgi:hypothetical protein